MEFHMEKAYTDTRGFPKYETWYKFECSQRFAVKKMFSFDQIIYCKLHQEIFDVHFH